MSKQTKPVIRYFGGKNGKYEATDSTQPGVKFTLAYVGAGLWELWRTETVKDAKTGKRSPVVTGDIITDEELPNGLCNDIAVWTEIDGVSMWRNFGYLVNKFQYQVPPRPMAWWGELNGGYAAAEEWRSYLEDAYYDTLADAQPEVVPAEQLDDDWELLKALCAKLGVAVPVRPQPAVQIADVFDPNQMRMELGLADQPKKLTKAERKAQRRQAQLAAA